ncbi:hypothetical protein B296_00018591 [Ensete ventricosum]|uniref:Uncharacterized protein n=1 Tax=Ensete ventricosum TaxID=4639 RepID=A0A427AJC0_ENSVE|nr:hypothetical protein B296_00018591 [Ensete ventricosum]
MVVFCASIFGDSYRGLRTSERTRFYTRNKDKDRHKNIFFPANSNFHHRCSIDPLPSVLEPDLDLLRLDVGEDRTFPYELLPSQGARLRALAVDPLERLHLLRRVPHVLPRIHRRSLLQPLPHLLPAYNHRHLAPARRPLKLQPFPTQRTHRPQKPHATPFLRLLSSGRRITAPQELPAEEGCPIFLCCVAAIALRRRGNRKEEESGKEASCSVSVWDWLPYALYLAFIANVVVVAAFVLVFRAGML